MFNALTATPDKTANSQTENPRASEDTRKSEQTAVKKIVVVGLLVCAACIPFYLITAMMSCTYIFFVLRRRMADIEIRLNEYLQIPSFLSYERVITPYFLENSQYARIAKYMPAFTPHALSTVWRSLIFFTVIVELIAMAYLHLGLTIYFGVYSLALGMASGFQLWQYLWLYRKGLKNIEEVVQRAAKGTALPEIEKPFITLFRTFLSFLKAIKATVRRYPHFLVILGIAIASALTWHLLWEIYLNLTGQAAAPLSYWNILPQIFFYEVACAIYFPPLSEAPLLLYRSVPLPLILLVAALGKGSGAYLACFFGQSIGDLFGWARWFIWRKPHPGPLEKAKSICDRWVEWVTRMIKRWGFWAYLTMQSIPFAPMRSSTYIYSTFERRKITVAVGAAIGTVFRFLFMLALAHLGYYSYMKIF